MKRAKYTNAFIFVKLIILCSFLLALNGCLLNQHNSCIKNKLFSSKSSDRINADIKEIMHSGSSLSNEKKLKLSVLYSHKDNLKPDYNEAYNMIDKYIKNTPEQDRVFFSSYLYSLLKKIKTQSNVMRKSNILLKKEKKKKNMLIAKNKELQKKISSLKSLDIRLEKHRLGTE